jgi:hypothetical protein
MEAVVTAMNVYTLPGLEQEHRFELPQQLTV